MVENCIINGTPTEQIIVNKKNIHLIICSLIVGILFNFLFVGNQLGISYPIFVIAFYGAWYLILGKNFSFKLNFGWLLSIPIFLLSFTYFMFSNNIFSVLNFIGIPILIVIQTTILSKSSTKDWFNITFVNDIIFGFFGRPFLFIDRPFKIILKIFERKTNSTKLTIITKIFVGLIVAIPLILIIISLLSSADQIFNNLISKIPFLFKNVNFNEFIFRSLLVIFITLSFFSYTWSLIHNKLSNINIISEKLATPKRILDSIITATILTSINIIYLAFTIIQFAYLFGMLSYGLPKELTYAEYARRGFFELVVITLINLFILIMNINFSKKEGKIMWLMQNILNTLLIAFTLIILISAHLRMSLYEEVYGYSYLRVLTHSFMVFIFTLLIVTLIRVWYEKIALLKAYIILALIAYTLLNYLNIDWIIAKKNIELYYKTGNLDMYTLDSLSGSAVPEIIKLINDKNHDTAVRAENCLYAKKEYLKENTQWQSFNLSKYFAYNILKNYNLQYHQIDYSR